MTIQNFKPFNLDEFRNGKLAILRDMPRIEHISFVAEHEDFLWIRYSNGDHTTFRKGFAQEALVMKPEVKEAWINLYNHPHDSGKSPGYLYPTESEATTIAQNSRGYFKTIKISWEE